MRMWRSRAAAAAPPASVITTIRNTEISSVQANDWAVR